MDPQARLNLGYLADNCPPIMESIAKAITHRATQIDILSSAVRKGLSVHFSYLGVEVLVRPEFQSKNFSAQSAKFQLIVYVFREPVKGERVETVPQDTSLEIHDGGIVRRDDEQRPNRFEAFEAADAILRTIDDIEHSLPVEGLLAPEGSSGG